MNIDGTKENNNQYITSLRYYQNIQRCQLTQLLREKTHGYNNNNDFSNRVKIRKLRDEYLEEREQEEQQKTINKNQPLQEHQIEEQRKCNMLSVIYRFMLTADPRLRKFYMQIRTQVESIGIQPLKSMLPKNQTNQQPSQLSLNPEDQLRLQQLDNIYKIYKNSKINQDDFYMQFKEQLTKAYKDLFKLSANDEDYNNLIRLLCDLESQESIIMRTPILDERDPARENVVKEYGLDIPAISEQFQDSYTINQDNNILNFKLMSDQDEQIYKFQEQQSENIRQVRLNDDINYIRQFYDKFKTELIQASPKYWQLLLFDLFKDLCKKSPVEELELQLISKFQCREGVDYLLIFRKEIVAQLRKSNFMRKPNKSEKNTSLNSSNTDNSKNEGSMQVDTNLQMLQLIGVDAKELEQETKLGLRRKMLGRAGKGKMEQISYKQNGELKIPEKYDGQSEFTEIDFIKQDQQQLQIKYPNFQKKDNNEYVQFRFDAPPKKKHDEKDLIQISDLPLFAQKCFEGFEKFNYIQTKTFKAAFTTDDNILLSSPTGSGKTNVALMAILHEIQKHLNSEMKLLDNNFKIVYISPMKALASEIVEKFLLRLKGFGICVRELTGDMQLSRKELDDTHIIITTPEKWDVVTRKNNTVSQQLQLLIIDEIHLLNDERGPVLECLVARTLQNIERQQKCIRFMGLSATLPNYLDVAAFIHVEKANVFHFDAQYRPIPLTCRYIGVKEPMHLIKGPRRRQADIYNEVCYDLAHQVLSHHKQVLVFVHSRKETVMTAKYFFEKGQKDRLLHQYRPKSTDKSTIARIQDKDLGKLVPEGLGFHHAGMLRRDRNIIEKMFLEGNLKVLFSTATLAWGINLPAHSVIIKGTDIFDPMRGGQQNLSILDVQQMFGRAGRPQFDDSGEATLMTDIGKVNQYIGQLSVSMPLESKLQDMINEALNAEIVLGNITNINEAFDWINHTFFNIRLRRSPEIYKCPIQQEYGKQVSTEMFLTDKIEESLKQLDNLRLIRFDRKTGYLSSTELGRITSHYYIACDTMALFCKEFGINVDQYAIEDFQQQIQNNFSDQNNNQAQASDFHDLKHQYKTDLDILMILAGAKEFENIKVRQEEIKEIKKIIKENWILEEKLDLESSAGGFDIVTDHQTLLQNQQQQMQDLQQSKIGNSDEIMFDKNEKIVALISGYLCRCTYENFSLTSDSQFIIQNSIRLLRCLLEICQKKNMAFQFELIHKWCKLIENRMVPGQSPLRQFCKENYQGYNTFKQRKEHKEGFLSRQLVERIEKNNLAVSEIIEMTPQELAHIMDTRPNLAQEIQKYARQIPYIEVQYAIKPIAQTVLKVDVFVTPKWQMSPRWHSSAEIFWIVVDDEKEILHIESFVIGYKIHKERSKVELNFFLPFHDQNQKYYRISVVSDSWIMDNDFSEQINLSEIKIQGGNGSDFTELLDLHPLPVTALQNQEFQKLYKYRYFNPNQTQVFHALYHTDENTLIGSPTGSGKTIMAEFAVLRVFAKYPGSKAIYIAPLKAIAMERLKDWRLRFQDGIKKQVIELTGDFTPDLDTLMKADMVITTPEKWDGISRNWNNRAYVQQVKLVIFDEIHLLGQDRGPVLEVIVSRMNLIASKTGNKVRMIGLSTAMANGVDVAEWFGVPRHFFFNFRPHVRPVPITIYFDGFSEKNYCPRMASMNKPAYNSIKKFSDGKPVLVFVSSRRQTRLTALDLVAYAINDVGAQSPFIKCDVLEIQQAIAKVKDDNLKQTLSFGIGMHHAGLIPDDRRVVEDLFVNNKIQVTIATSTLAWGVNFPARLVIIKGTEYFDPKSKRYVDVPVTDILQMIGRAGRPQFDDKGIACVFVEQSKKNFYRKYLNDPFPIESSLISQIHDHFNAEINCGTINNKQQCIDWVTWTYFFRRLLKNPSYYNLLSVEPKVVKQFLIQLVDESIKRLCDSRCIKVDEESNFKLEPTFLGHLAAFYYVKHETISEFDKKITKTIELEDILRTLAYAKEYEEIPVRHNEENLNEELANNCPLKCNKYAYDSPQEKTFLLFQAHLFRIPLPIRDYITDSKIAVDSSIRLLHAMIDLSAEKQYLTTTRNLIKLMQMICQGVWKDEKSPLINVPFLNNEDSIKQLGISKLSQLLEKHYNKKLADFLQAKLPNYNFTEEKLQQIQDALNSVPEFKMKIDIFPFDSLTLQKKESPDEQLEPGGEAIISIHVHRLNSQFSQRVVIQATSKNKDASWWLVIANEVDDTVLGLKKLYFKNFLKKEIQIQLPKDFSKVKKITVSLMSDSYIGLDETISIPLENSQEKQSKKQ